MIKFITNPYYAFILLTFVVVILLLIYKYIKKPSEKLFLSNELLLLIIGIIGVLAIISKNQDLKKRLKLESKENQIKNDFRFLKNHLNTNYYCLEYLKSPYLSDEEWSSRNKIRSKTCNWAKRVKEILEKVNITEYNKIPKIPLITKDIKNQYNDIGEITKEIDRINKSIEDRNKVKKGIKRINILGNIDDTLGVIFLLIGLGIKLSELIYKLDKNEKKNS